MPPRARAAWGRLNAALDAGADRITAAVGTTWCALGFAALAIVATPGLFPAPVTAVATWVAQAFLQLVLLAVIQTGQNRGQQSMDRLVRETHDVVLVELSAQASLVGEVHAIATALHASLSPSTTTTPNERQTP
jgi:hypothetical protein